MLHHLRNKIFIIIHWSQLQGLVYYFQTIDTKWFSFGRGVMYFELLELLADVQFLNLLILSIFLNFSLRLSISSKKFPCIEVVL